MFAFTEFEKRFEADDMTRDEVREWSRAWREVRMQVNPDYRQKIDDRIALLESQVRRGRLFGLADDATQAGEPVSYRVRVV
jgi:hypothetical protein